MKPVTIKKTVRANGPGGKTAKKAKGAEVKGRRSEADASRRVTKSGAIPQGNPKEWIPGGKTARVMDLLGRQKGATLTELMKVTGWQRHSIRGFISWTLGKKMGLLVASAKDPNGDRRYSLAR